VSGTAHLDQAAPENDWCMEEDKLTSWTGDKCDSCGRLWGMPASSDEALLGAETCGFVSERGGVRCQLMRGHFREWHLAWNENGVPTLKVIAEARR